jgi:hypothetical protein
MGDPSVHSNINGRVESRHGTKLVPSIMTIGRSPLKPEALLRVPQRDAVFRRGCRAAQAERGAVVLTAVRWEGRRHAGAAFTEFPDRLPPSAIRARREFRGSAPEP